MVAAYLASALLMGALVVAVVAAVVRGRRWYSYDLETSSATHPGIRPGETSPSIVERTSTWLLAFVVLSLGAVAGVFAFVSNPASAGGLTSVPVLAFAGLLVAGYVLIGVYVTARQRGHPDSLAAAEVAIIGGVLMLLGITATLLSG